MKPSQEMSWLYGNHVLKSGLGRITEDTPAYQVKMCVRIIPSGCAPLIAVNCVFGRSFAPVSPPTPQGVVVYNMNDVPLGFGVTAKSTVDCRKLEPGAVIVFHQSDVGEYLRSEDGIS